MLKVCRVTKVNVFFLVVVYVFNFELFEFSAAILEKGLLPQSARQSVHKKRCCPVAVRNFGYIHVSCCGNFKIRETRRKYIVFHPGANK